MNAVAGNNPYVGPRPFETKDKLYGREREITELDHLLSAERVVLISGLCAGRATRAAGESGGRSTR